MLPGSFSLGGFSLAGSSRLASFVFLRPMALDGFSTSLPSRQISCNPVGMVDVPDWCVVSIDPTPNFWTMLVVQSHTIQPKPTKTFWWQLSTPVPKETKRQFDATFHPSWPPNVVLVHQRHVVFFFRICPNAPWSKLINSIPLDWKVSRKSRVSSQAQKLADSSPSPFWR